MNFSGDSKIQQASMLDTIQVNIAYPVQVFLITRRLNKSSISNRRLWKAKETQINAPSEDCFAQTLHQTAPEIGSFK